MAHAKATNLCSQPYTINTFITPSVIIHHHPGLTHLINSTIISPVPPACIQLCMHCPALPFLLLPCPALTCPILNIFATYFSKQPTNTHTKKDIYTIGYYK